MMCFRTALSTAALLGVPCAPASAQVTPYGSPTPSGFGVELTNGPFQSFAGNANFQLRLTGPNAFGGGLFVALSRASIPLGAWTLLLDPLTLQASAFPLIPGVISQSLPLPRDPSVFGFSVTCQALLFTSSGIGATNGAEVSIQRFRTPTRGYFPGADYAQGLISPGQFATMDLSIWPPVFRATGDAGYNSTAGQNFPVAAAVSDRLDYAFLHGNTSTNPFIRVFDISADPEGVVAHALLGDIPLAHGPSTTITYSDLEVSRDGRWLFCTTGSNPLQLLVFDLSGLPGNVPTAPVQSFSFASVTPGAALLEVSPDDRMLALCLSSTSSADVFLYDITAALAPLVTRTSLFVPGAGNAGAPSAIDFSLNSRRLFVVAGGTFSYYDVTTSPTVALISGATWTRSGISLFGPVNGGTLAVQNGRTVAVAAEAGYGALFHLIDLAEPPGPRFGTVIQSFTTNPSTNLPGGNIGNARLHALGNLVVGVDGAGPMLDGMWIDVFDLDLPNPLTGFEAVRIQMPSSGQLSPFGNRCIPYEFDLR